MDNCLPEGVEGEEVIWTQAQNLRIIMQDCLAELAIQGRISMAVTLDVIRRWRRDVLRLEDGQPKGVHPVKYIAYQVFWIRKLKPVSDAYRISDLKQREALGDRVLATREIITINERLAVHVAVKSLRRWATTGKYPLPKGGDGEQWTPLDVTILDEHLHEYLKFPDQPERKGSTYENLIYNQRFRTFGPHHLSHILDQAVFGTLREQAFRSAHAPQPAQDVP
ncbi:hypothetical protein MTBLM5_20233 [Magnetospirillum sp. LM-5]|uniref:hypothetical protein n=1 Tax=Magnetospirillum sp. LM-5 TaxID=2681466 RepID=UPI00137DC0D1|nr:hypothetical protein [Magnetospirillum sp. LM-5]CAA7616805.1 hypothetical protein MTBLM5_20233 [Magnetospirillum sp. LM-5]